MAFDWKSLLKGGAPMLATALGGPLAGAAAKLLVTAFDPSGKTNPNDPLQVDKLMEGVTLDPANLVKLKEIEADFQEKMAAFGYQDAEAIRQYNLESERVAAGDRASARSRQVALRDWTPTALAIGVTIGFFGLLGYMLKHEVPAQNKDVLNIMLGSLGSAWVGIVAYYFGSSAGSDRKTEIMGQGVKRDA